VVSGKPLAARLVALVVTLAAVAAAQRLRRPVACETCIANWYYFDHAAAGSLRDWTCGTSTYDGHGGSDFSLRGGLAAIDTGFDVVAAAEGTVLSASDGYFDRCTACATTGTQCTNATTNMVVVRHRDKVTRYLHLRKGSVRVRAGDAVTCGQVLGQIASSGCSTGAHLHFEVLVQGVPQDPRKFLEAGEQLAQAGARSGNARAAVRGGTDAGARIPRR